MTLRDDLVHFARELLRRGLVKGSSGNLSFRDRDEQVMWITPSALPYDEMTPEDCVAVDLASGTIREGTRRPSSETPMHRAVYLAREDAGAVVHTHSLFATMFAIANQPVPPVHYIMAEIGDAIPVAPYATYGSDALAESAVETLQQAHGILLQNHGVLTIGNDLATAFRRAETIETVAQLAWGARLLGDIQVLTPEQMATVRSQLRTYFQP